MVDGRWLLCDGALCTMDEELIVREADGIGRAIWQRLLRSVRTWCRSMGYMLLLLHNAETQAWASSHTPSWRPNIWRIRSGSRSVPSRSKIARARVR